MPKEKDLLKLHLAESKDFTLKPQKSTSKSTTSDRITKPMSRLKIGESSTNKCNNNKKKKVKHPPSLFWKSNADEASTSDKASKKKSKEKERSNTLGSDETKEIEVAKNDTDDVPITWDELLTDEVAVEGKSWDELTKKDKNDKNNSDSATYSWNDCDLFDCDDTVDLKSLKSNNNQEQRQLSANLEISGVPRVKNEDLVFIIRKIGDHVNVRVDESDIVSVQRELLKRNEAGLPPVPIICKFRSREMKDNIIMRIRKLRRITTNDIGFFGDVRFIYIQHHLTPYNKALYNACRKAAKEKNYKFVWIKAGKIYVREDNGGPALRIETFENIENKIV